MKGLVRQDEKLYISQPFTLEVDFETCRSRATATMSFFNYFITEKDLKLRKPLLQDNFFQIARILGKRWGVAEFCRRSSTSEVPNHDAGERTSKIVQLKRGLV